MDYKIMSLIVTNGIPLVKSYVLSQIEEENNKKSIILDSEKTNRQFKLYDNFKGGNNPAPIDNSPQMTKEEIGRQMWNESHEAIENLDENADKKQVKKVMKKIEKEFKHHPCMECQIHAKKNLKELPITNETTKEGAKQKLCQFHNRVNDMLDKPEFNCETWSY